MQFDNKNHPLLFFIRNNAAENSISTFTIDGFDLMDSSSNLFLTSFCLERNTEIEGQAFYINIQENEQGKKVIGFEPSMLSFRNNKKIYVPKNSNFTTEMLIELSNMIKPLMKILLKDKDKVNEFLKQLLSIENNTINQIEIEIQTDSDLLEYYTQVWTTEVFNRKRDLLHKRVYNIKQLQKPYLLKQYEGNQEELFQIMKDNDNWEEIVELMYGF
jgi:hypothetical protein